MKKIIFVISCAIALVAVSLLYFAKYKHKFYTKSRTDISQTYKPDDWIKNYPVLKRIPSRVNNTKAVSTNIQSQKSQEELLGSITNPFGISDDILEVILKNYSQSNYELIAAAIKLAQYDQQMLFAKNLQELRTIANKGYGASICLGYYEYQVNPKFRSNFIEEYSAAHRNNKVRKAAWDRVELALSGSIISSDYESGSPHTLDKAKVCRYVLEH